MRTTLTLDDDVADALKELARRFELTFKQVVNDTLRRGLSPVSDKPRTPYRVEPHRSGLRSGVDMLRLNQLSDELQSDQFQTQDDQ